MTAKEQRAAKRRAEHRAWLRQHAPTLAAMYDESRAGHCVCCDELMPAGSVARVHDDAECKRLWQFVYALDRRNRERAAGVRGPARHTHREALQGAA